MPEKRRRALTISSNDVELGDVRIMRYAWLPASVMLLIALVAVAGNGESGQLTYSRGQNVVAAFEGWERHADGTLGMVFSYFNRNYEEIIDVPIGPDNNIEPGGPDRDSPHTF